MAQPQRYDRKHDFTLDEEEIRTLSNLPVTGFSGLHPDTVSF